MHVILHLDLYIAECASATSGSFVRVPKLRRGIDYATAVRRKYAGEEEETDEASAAEGVQTQESGGAYVESASGRRVEVELCGKEQAIAKLKELAASRDRVYLPNALVATMGAPGSVRFLHIKFFCYHVNIVEYPSHAHRCPQRPRE